MNTTCDIFPASFVTAHSNDLVDKIQPRKTAPQTMADSSKAGSAFWEMAGGTFVLMIGMVLVGLWSWALVEFLRFYMEIMARPNSLEVVLR